ncbi:hypothetical protein I204_08228, partial [Kwoniella mangroviensis CBS 8886]
MAASSVGTAGRHRNPRVQVSCDGCRRRKSDTPEIFTEQLPGLPLHVENHRNSLLQTTMGPELVSGGQPDRPSDLSEATPSSSMTLVGNSAGGLNDLIKLYFRTVHHFGYLSFVHEADYWELKERNCAPEDLSLLMAAHAV